MKETEIEGLCSQTIVTDARAALGGCEDAFREVNEAFRALDPSQRDLLQGVSFPGRFSWPFKRGKFETLQANLERLKTTLLLMLMVLGYAKDKLSTFVNPSPKIRIWH